MQKTRTTVNLPTPLLREAKIYAATQNRTVTDVITEGICIVIGKKSASKPKQSFSDFLDSRSPLPQLTQEQQDEHYRAYLKEKHG
jgi:hypothetical protein